VKAYQFRLATVARIRALEERVAADALRLAQRDLRRAQASVRAAEDALAALEAPHGVVAMSTVLWVGDQAERLADAVRACGERMTAAASSCAEARAAWDVAVRRSEVLARLGEQGLARWRAETLREEAAELDDLTLARHGLAGVGR
jgi:flagellar export protein FliJ